MAIAAAAREVYIKHWTDGNDTRRLFCALDRFRESYNDTLPEWGVTVFYAVSPEMSLLGIDYAVSDNRIQGCESETMT